MIDPLAADHSCEPTQSLNYSFKITVESVSVYDWFFFSFLALLSEKNTSLQRATQPSTLEGSDQRNQEMRSAFSLCFNTLSSSYRSITNLPARADVIFFPPTASLPPRVSTTFLPEINARPVEAATKTVITQNAANSWVITAYFICRPCGSHTGSKERQHPPIFQYIFMDSVIFKYRERLCAHLSIFSASLRMNRTKPVQKWFSSRRNKVSNKSSHDTKGWGRITNKWVRFAAFQQPS